MEERETLLDAYELLQVIILSLLLQTRGCLLAFPRGGAPICRGFVSYNLDVLYGIVGRTKAKTLANACYSCQSPRPIPLLSCFTVAGLSPRTLNHICLLVGPPWGLFFFAMFFNEFTSAWSQCSTPGREAAIAAATPSAPEQRRHHPRPILQSEGVRPSPTNLPMRNQPCCLPQRCSGDW